MRRDGETFRIDPESGMPMPPCLRRRPVSFILSVSIMLATLCGCATLPPGSSRTGDDGASAWLRGLFHDGKLPASAQNVHACAESFSVGSLLFASFDAQTKDLEEALAASFWLAHPRALVEEGEGKKMLMPPLPLGMNCPWWTPNQARRFGSVDVVRYYRDRLDGEASLRKFYYLTTTKAGVGDAGSGRSVIFIQVSVNEPQQERE